MYVLAAAGTPGAKPDLGRAIGLILAANGVTASFRLFGLVYSGISLGPLTETDRLYLLIGAIAALWLSFQTIGRTFANVLPEGAENGTSGKPQDEESPK